MENIVPVTGRVLRYWCGSLAILCRHQLCDFLGVKVPGAPTLCKSPDALSWVGAEVWSQPEPGNERTVVLQNDAGNQKPRQKVRMSAQHLTQPVARRPGTIVRATFQCARSRLGRSRTAPGTGFS